MNIEKQQKEDKEFLELAKKRLEKAIDGDNDNRIAAVEDLHFLQGDQWEPAEKQRRKDRGRPCLQINVLPKYTKQVCGEMRKNKMQIKIRPVDSKADINLAKIREGIIYSIEYASNAQSIYDHAAKMLVSCGYGAWRILTRYTKENPFLQEIYMEKISNPFSVYIDPAAKDQNFADAEWAFILTKMNREDFIEKYGKDALPGGDLMETPAVGTRDEFWWDRDTVTIAEYFYTEYDEKTMCLLSDGQILEKEKAKEFIASAKEAYGEIKAINSKEEINEENIPEIINTRKVEEPKIKWKMITATRILDEKDWAGKYIPIVMVTGEEIDIEGKKYINGLIRGAKDSQRLLNYWHTTTCETVALAPKAQWQATAKQIEGYEKDYLSANEENLPVLLYNNDPDAPLPKPERVAPGQPPAAVFTEVGRAEQSIKDTIGLYNADVGDTSNEHLRDVSGKAVMARQMPGDTATYIYPDNLAMAIAHGGKIINDMIPKIYDTERDARVRNVDGTESFVPINTTLGNVSRQIDENPQRFSGLNFEEIEDAKLKQGETTRFNDITVGTYDVVVSTGPTFATQRMEAVENMVKIASAVNMNPVDKYFVVSNMDFPGSDEYAAVIKRMIPPELLPPEDREVRPPQPPSPEMMAEASKIELDKMKAMTEQQKLKLQILKLQKEISGDKANIRKEVVELLQELDVPEHPADQINLGGM